MFDSDENAIVDFKYAASEKLTWWFDHHESAFLTPEDEAHFRADKSGKKFLDATRKSCTEFIADVAHERFGFNAEPIKSLIHWAHIIDGALYESPAQCVELKEPALQLMQVIEADPDDSFIEQIIRDLTINSLEEVATSAEVQRRFKPILQQHLETLETVRRKAIAANGVVQFDLIDEGYEGFNKFIPYYLHPETTYSVALTRGHNEQRSRWLESLGAGAAHTQHREDLRTLRRRRSRGSRRGFIQAGRGGRGAGGGERDRGRVIHISKASPFECRFLRNQRLKAPRFWNSALICVLELLLISQALRSGLIARLSRRATIQTPRPVRPKQQTRRSAPTTECKSA